MNKTKSVLRAALLPVFFVFVALACPVSARANDVKSYGNMLMIKARKLVSKNTCSSLKLAKRAVGQYEELGRDYPGELPSRSRALAEIGSFIGRHCTVVGAAGPTIVYTSAPIVTIGGGGLICTHCGTVPGADDESAEIPKISVPGCIGCPQVDILSLAAIYMDDEEKAKFLDKLDPAVKAKIFEFETANPATVETIKKSLRQELSTPGGVVSPGAVQVPSHGIGIPGLNQLPGGYTIPGQTTPGTFALPSHITLPPVALPSGPMVPPASAPPPPDTETSVRQ